MLIMKEYPHIACVSTFSIDNIEDRLRLHFLIDRIKTVGEAHIEETYDGRLELILDIMASEN